MSKSSSTASVARDPGFPAWSTLCATNNKVSLQHFKSIVTLLQDDLTVPFIARYKRQLIGQDTTADIVYQIKSDLENFEKVISTKSKRLKELVELKICDKAIEAMFNNCTTMEELNELWSTYKPAKDNKLSSTALAHTFTDLVSVSESLIENKTASWTVSKTFDADRTMSASQALILLLISQLSSDVALREHCTSFIKSNLTLECKFKRGLDAKVKETSKYKDYDGFSRKLIHVHSNQLFAIRRGENDDILSVKHTVTDSAISAVTFQILDLLKVNKSGVRLPINDKDEFNTIFASYFDMKRSVLTRNEVVGIAACETVRKGLVPSIISLCYKNAIKKAEADALRIFAQNVSNLLMVPPLFSYLDSFLVSLPTSDKPLEDVSNSSKRRKVDSSLEQSGKSTIIDLTNASSTSLNQSKKINRGSNICGFDPGFSNGNKLVILSNSGKLLHSLKIFIPSERDEKKYTSSVSDFATTLNTHNVGVISIGNGTGSFEALSFCKKAISLLYSNTGGVCVCTVVSEAGASVYSASSTARDEYAGVDISYLGAISIAKRLVNPLTELVKIDPKSLGVGMYQHDLSTKELDESLNNVLEKCVSEVGIYLRDANIYVLQRLPGMNESKANSLLNSAASIGCRKDLLSVKGIGPITYNNIAGFIRVPNDHEPLDDTNVHPDQYDLVKSILQEIGFTSKFGTFKARHLGSSELINHLKSISTWQNIMDKLKIQENDLIDILSWISYKNYDSSMESSNSSVSDRFLKLSGGIILKTHTLVVRSSIPTLISHLLDDCRNDSSKTNGIKGGKSDNSTEESSTTKVGIGSVIEGVVQNITTFGIFLDLRLPFEALFPSSLKRKIGDDDNNNKLSKSNNAYSPTGLLHISKLRSPIASYSLGQKVRVKIESIDSDRRRIALGLA